MYYQLYEWNHALMSPARALNDAVRLYYKNPLNPLCYTELGRQIVAAGDVFERLTRRYGKPEFGLESVEMDGQEVRVHERIVWEQPFCRLIHFHRDRPEGAPKQPNLVIVAPMSGHYATLLRGTVAAMLPHFEVYITDWVDARMVPLAMGGFDLDDYIDYMIAIVHWLKGDCHLMAVCQPAVPVFAATALLEADEKAHRPKSIVLMGGPIDTRENPTEVNLYAEKHDLDWFRRNVIMTVPLPHPGFLRQVYPGFLQLSGFMSMNFDRHLSAHYDYFDHLVKGDGDSAEKHREFYDEYLSVMDLTAEFFLQTVDTVFHHHRLPKGEMTHRRRPVLPRKITRTAIMTVEGENDDISGLGQTRAAHALTPDLPAEKHVHHMQEGVGHYGVFNGSRFRREIAPRIREFVYRWDGEATGKGNGRGRATGTGFAAGVAAADAAATFAGQSAEAAAATAADVAEATFSSAAAAVDFAAAPANGVDGSGENAAPDLAGEVMEGGFAAANEAARATPPDVASAGEPAAAAVALVEAPAENTPATASAEEIAAAAADAPAPAADVGEAVTEAAEAMEETAHAVAAGAAVSNDGEDAAHAAGLAPPAGEDEPADASRASDERDADVAAEESATIADALANAESAGEPAQDAMASGGAAEDEALAPEAEVPLAPDTPAGEEDAASAAMAPDPAPAGKTRRSWRRGGSGRSKRS